MHMHGRRISLLREKKKPSAKKPPGSNIRTVSDQKGLGNALVLLHFKGLAVGALIHGRVLFMRTDEDTLQRTIIGR